MREIDSGFILDDDESKYREQVCALEDWFDLNNLLLNVPKTKDPPAGWGAFWLYHVDLLYYVTNGCDIA